MKLLDWGGVGWSSALVVHTWSTNDSQALLTSQRALRWNGHAAESLCDTHPSFVEVLFCFLFFFLLDMALHCSPDCAGT